MPLLRVYCQHISPPDWREKEFSQTAFFLDIWRVPLSLPDHVFEALKGLLTDEESQQANRFIRKEDRIRNILGKGLLRKLLQVYLNKGQPTIHFGKNRFNKPFLIGRDSLHFNISHSRDWVVIALSGNEVGIDIEAIDSSSAYQDLIHQWFEKSEIKYVQESPDPLLSFFEVWTRKEALLKATGIGIIDNLNQFCCLDGKHGFFLPENIETKNWRLLSFRMDQGYHLSLSFPEANIKPRFFNWDVLPYF